MTTTARRDQRGAAAVEFAMVVPLVVLLFGLVVGLSLIHI